MVASGLAQSHKKKRRNIYWADISPTPCLGPMLAQLFWPTSAQFLMGLFQLIQYGLSAYHWANPSPLYIYNINIILYNIKNKQKIQKSFQNICGFLAYFLSILLNIDLYFYIVKIQIRY